MGGESLLGSQCGGHVRATLPSDASLYGHFSQIYIFLNLVSRDLSLLFPLLAIDFAVVETF